MDFEYVKKTFVSAVKFPTGIACLLSIIKFHGGAVAPWLLVAWSGTKEGLTTLAGLKKAATNVGLKANVRIMNVEELQHVVTPVILFFENEQGKKDFVVCYGFDGDRFVVGDTSWGLMQYWPEEMEVMWIKGICMTLPPDKNFISEYEQKKAINHHICNYIKSDKPYLLISTLGAFLFSSCFLLWNVFEKSIYNLSFIFLLVAIFYYIFAGTYLNWKVNTKIKLSAFYCRIVRKEAFDAMEKFDCLLEEYPRTGIQIIYTAALYVLILTCFICKGSFLILIPLLYIPFFSWMICRYKANKEKYFINAKENINENKNKKADISKFRIVEEMKAVCVLRTNELILLNAGVAGLICSSEIWMGLLVFVLSSSVTACCCKLYCLKELINSMYDVYIEYRKGGYFEKRYI